LKEPIRDLLKQLHEHIDSGAYKLLIGGDTSGRIPTLIFNKVIKKIYQEKDFHVPQTMALFIAGGDREGKSEKIKAHIQKHYAKQNFEIRNVTLIELIKEKLKLGTFSGLNGRVLIIEDTIASGSSIKPVTDALKKTGIKFDIATIGFLGDRTCSEKDLGGKVFYSFNGTPSIYGMNSLSGVKKERGDLFSRPYVSDKSKKARLDADIVANELAEWYISNF